MTGPVGGSQEEQAVRELGLEARSDVLEDLKAMVANKSRPAVSTRMAGDRSGKVTDKYFEPFSGPRTQSSSQGELSVGKVVGQLRMASQEMKGVVANKGISAISTRVGGSGSMVAARRLVFEPEKKLPEESMGLVKKAVQSMEEGARVMENDVESRGKVAKPVARKVVVAFRKNGRKVSTICSRIDESMKKKEVSSPFGEGTVKMDNNLRDKGESRTVASKRGRGE